ncbi:MAG: hypothetical protein KDI27_07835 [Gammaproteobacteria bacterium]|nr:hypothetical protein [Gammaproteobacteria bacterium]MCP5416243.1 hypothetical protein [Chromatiaceae bacterium]
MDNGYQMKNDNNILLFPGTRGQSISPRPGAPANLSSSYPETSAIGAQAGDASTLLSAQFDLINEQCDLLLTFMQAVSLYLETGSPERAEALAEVARRSVALRGYHASMIGHTSAGDDALLDVIRVAVVLDMSIEYFATAARDLVGIGSLQDHFILEMAQQNERCAKALNRGFFKLSTEPSLIQQEIATALQAHRTIQQCYTRAMSALSAESHGIGIGKANRAVPETASRIYSFLRRREIYQCLFKIGKRLSWALARLSHLATKAGCNTPRS